MMESRENIGKRLNPRHVTLQALGVNSVEDFIWKCLNDLFYFESVVLHHGKDVEYRDLNHIHKQACDFLGFSTNPSQQKLLLMSRDSLKSTMGRGLMEQEFLRASVGRTERLFAIYTGNIDLAEEHLKIMTNEILRNELIQAYFAGYVPTKGSEADVWTQEKIRYKRIGFDIGSLKKSLSGKHYAGMWTDNLMNEQNFKTPELRRSTYLTWQANESTIAKDAWEIVSETPWESDDLSGRILHPDCRFNYKEIYRKSPARFLSKTGYDVFSCFSRNEKGELNFPELQDEAYLARKKRKQGTYLYMRMYEGQIVSDESMQIKKSDWRYYEELPLNYIRFINVDCSGTKGTDSSPSGVTITDWSDEEKLYIPYAEKKKVTPMELFDWLVELYDKSQKEGRIVTWVNIEREKYGIFLQDLMERDRPDILVLDIPLKGRPRPVRHLKILPYFENHQILMKRGLEQLEGEIDTWYKGKDTGVDLIDSIFLAVEQKMIPARLKVPAEDPHMAEDDNERAFLKKAQQAREGHDSMEMNERHFMKHMY